MMEQQPLILKPADFVAIIQQTLEYTFPRVILVGELANFRISKNKWIYFDLKDSEASVRCFGTIYSLPTPLKNGMLLRVAVTPRMHPEYGFSCTVQSIQLEGEGVIKKAQLELEKKLEVEGLFSLDKKRPLPYPPKSVGLVTSIESAAYADFTTILANRTGGMKVKVCDVQVQGVDALMQLINAIDYFNTKDKVDIIVIIRGGGSADDLQTFNTERLTRSIASSRTPTLVAIGHETDVSLAERAADRRASTPSNAAEIIAPTKNETIQELNHRLSDTQEAMRRSIEQKMYTLNVKSEEAFRTISSHIDALSKQLTIKGESLAMLNPRNVLKRGYAIVRFDNNDEVVVSESMLKKDQLINIEFSDGKRVARVQ